MSKAEEIKKLKAEVSELREQVFGPQKTESKNDIMLNVFNKLRYYYSLDTVYQSPTLKERLDEQDNDLDKVKNQLHLLLKHLNLEYVKTTTKREGQCEEATEGFQPINKPTEKADRRHNMSAAHRRAISKALKARWAKAK